MVCPKCILTNVFKMWLDQMSSIDLLFLQFICLRGLAQQRFNKGYFFLERIILRLYSINVELTPKIPTGYLM